MKCLLVTIVIGEKYLEEYYKLFYESQKNYALKNNYDFKVITEFLDKENQDTYSISFNKVLVCSQEWSTDYDFIIFVDADILININSPPIHNCIDYEGCIGIVDEYSQPSSERRILIQKRNGFETSASDYYKIYGFDLDTNMVFNSGVMVMQPRIHKDFLFNIYNNYKITSMTIYKTKKKATHKDQPYIGFEIQKNNLYKVMDNKFNAIWGIAKSDNIEKYTLNTYFQDNYFIHFAGHTDYDKIKYIQQKPAF